MSNSFCYIHLYIVLQLSIWYDENVMTKKDVLFSHVVNVSQKNRGGRINDKLIQK